MCYLCVLICVCHESSHVCPLCRGVWNVKDLVHLCTGVEVGIELGMEVGIEMEMEVGIGIGIGIRIRRGLRVELGRGVRMGRVLKPNATSRCQF